MRYPNGAIDFAVIRRNSLTPSCRSLTHTTVHSFCRSGTHEFIDTMTTTTTNRAIYFNFRDNVRQSRSVVDSSLPTLLVRFHIHGTFRVFGSLKWFTSTVKRSTRPSIGCRDVLKTLILVQRACDLLSPTASSGWKTGLIPSFSLLAATI